VVHGGIGAGAFVESVCLVVERTSGVVVHERGALMSEMRRLIEMRGIRFTLTSSSVRPFCGSRVNSLCGRVRTPARFTPAACAGWAHIPGPGTRSRVGLLPPVYLSNYPAADFAAYTRAHL
jgi:hypothetical protein